jgi:hypothetical protein
VEHKGLHGTKNAHRRLLNAHKPGHLQSGLKLPTTPFSSNQGRLSGVVRSIDSAFFFFEKALRWARCGSVPLQALCQPASIDMVNAANPRARAAVKFKGPGSVRDAFATIRRATYLRATPFEGRGLLSHSAAQGRFLRRSSWAACFFVTF